MQKNLKESFGTCRPIKQPGKWQYDTIIFSALQLYGKRFINLYWSFTYLPFRVQSIKFKFFIRPLFFMKVDIANWTFPICNCRRSFSALHAGTFSTLLRSQQINIGLIKQSNNKQQNKQLLLRIDMKNYKIA